jgi:Ca-activated chloride channel family protein
MAWHCSKQRAIGFGFGSIRRKLRRLLKHLILILNIHQYLYKTSTLLAIVLLFALHTNAQTKTQKPTRVLFILDASGSMNGKWKESTKMEMAKLILTHLADSLSRENIPYAIRVFGHQKDKSLVDCKDTKLELPFSTKNSTLLSSTLQRINPKGYSPIALSLEQSVNDFPLTKQEQRSIIILISDGFENCEGDACIASAKLQNSGIYLRPYIVGLGLTPEQRKQFECVGQIFDIQENDKQSEGAIANVVIRSMMNPTSLQINLLNVNEKPTETNVAMSFFNQNNGDLKNNFYHTLNAFNQPDTLYLDPTIKYKVKVHTLPAKTLNDVELTQGKHTMKALETPQGILKLSMMGNAKAKSIKCIVKQNGKIINVQDLNTSINYITGTYDVEVLTTPITKFNGVEISQSQTKTLSITNPGMLQINKQAGYLYIYKRDAKNHLERVYTIDSGPGKESISLQPGNYELIFRTKASTSSKASITKKVSIISGVSSSINF